VTASLYARQRGAAIITALLVVALVAVTAGALLAQQSQTLMRTEAVIARAQARAYSDTAVQWARSILADDARRDGPSGNDHFGEAWASGITALPVENAMISGTLSDEQGRFNLNNLVRKNAADSASVHIFRDLLKSLALPPDLANAVVDWIDTDSDTSSPGGAEDLAYLSLPSPYRAANQPLVQVDELLRVRGFDAKTVAKLRPFVTVLPGVTRININTAPLEVIAAALPELDETERLQLAKERMTNPFKDLNDIRTRFKNTVSAKYLNTDIDVKSSYFTANVAVSSGNVQLRTQTLLQRDPKGWPVIIWTNSL
jgi:general secretion pathway protein K